MAASFIRGKWNSKETCKSSMLMAKCCHDLDIISWMTGEIRPTYPAHKQSVWPMRLALRQRCRRSPIRYRGIREWLNGYAQYDRGDFQTM
ncbi:hypothetical protein [Paenibacillus alba]|uniref:hypothetical protein n=1 Tax=Paenibacillus alba TaxID=1197127 RepID=UPI001FE57507|nr:hypothetical protein [Paenibacillus alba]